jgi:hypothetical protein
MISSATDSAHKTILLNKNKEAQMNTSIATAVAEQISTLPETLQQKVLEFVQALKISERHGVHGKELLRFAGTIPPDDLQLMQKAIDDDLGQVDINEW